MKIVHIVGRSGNGKTTLMLDLIAEFGRRGLSVGTLKHSGHVHELEKPGKDSYRHRQAGAEPAAVVTPNQMAVFLPRRGGEDPFERLGPLFSACDIVLVEGYADGPGVNVEVWRASTGTDPLFAERRDIAAVVTDDPVETDLPVWRRSDVAGVADGIILLFGGASNF